ncbi:MAG: PEP-CTERM sorting domain-containing protein [Isosphaeraceae bacterium]
MAPAAINCEPESGEGPWGDIDVPLSINSPIGSYFNAINDAGQIVGTYDDPSINNHGFLATSVPEPASLTLAAIGGLLMAAYAWRCRR